MDEEEDMLSGFEDTVEELERPNKDKSKRRNVNFHMIFNEKDHM